MLRSLIQRLTFSLVTLLLIAYLVFWGLAMAGQAQAGAPVSFWGSAGQALLDTAGYIGQRLFGPTETYVWQRAPVPAGELVWLLLKHSAVLLLTAFFLAGALGVTLGVRAARSQRAWIRVLLPALSVLVVSTPSFLLGMFLWNLNAGLHRRFQVPVLPPTGYGFDAHLIMPALVLAARPLAQVVRVTYVTFTDIYRQDYIRTAVAKGLGPRPILWRHVLRNGLVPVLTTMVSGLRYSLSSLPVVEFFFVWPGLGLILLQAIEAGQSHLAADLVLTLGIIFIAINFFLEATYRLVDPRVAQPAAAAPRSELTLPLAERWRDVLDMLRGELGGLVRRQPAGPEESPPPPAERPSAPPARLSPQELAAEKARRAYQRRRWIQATFTNFPFMAGSLLVLGFFFIAIFGEQLAPTSPYQTLGVRYVQGQLYAPPFPPTLPHPSSLFDWQGVRAYLQGLSELERFEFPWGSDVLGRDLLSLVLAGAKRTLALGLFATLARVGLGAALGVLAGWAWRSRLDRLIQGLVELLQAFPTLLLAMVLILALDIRRGMPIFIIALAIVGWGEIMLLVRAQVIGLKGQPFVESAVAAGSNVPQLFVRHFLPNLLPTLIVVASLEMAGVLLLLAELGFLNIFMGGGAVSQIVEALKYHYSDVPEWGALLSNIRDWWRSYPWLAWYPGLFFAVAILAFNLWSEGLRYLLDQVGFGLNRLFNRYTVAFGGVLIVALVWTLRSVAPLGLYAPQTRAFNAGNVLADAARLSSLEFAGRAAGTPDARRAAEFIAARMKEVGLQPAGSSDTYFQSVQRSTFHLTGIPRLALFDPQGAALPPLAYRQDYVEVAAPYGTAGQAEGSILVTLLGPPPRTPSQKLYQLDARQTGQNILLVTSLEKLNEVQRVPRRGALVVVDDPDWFQRKFLLTASEANNPTLAISPQAAERLLQGSGYTLAELRRQEAALPPDQSLALPLPQRAELVVDGRVDFSTAVEQRLNVIGFIPGGRMAEGLDDRAIIISAHYDGLGLGPDGVFYPGANDNASGVATLLELARAWQNAPYKPHKTIIFVAWSGGERNELLSVVEVLNAKIGFATALEVEAVIELSGVGAGDGRSILLAEGTSYRLAQLFQAAAGRVGARTTLRGNQPHTGLFEIAPRGGRSALTAKVSWENSDALAHTPLDTVDTLDADKITAVGRTVFLAATVMGREVNY